LRTAPGLGQRDQESQPASTESPPTGALGEDWRAATLDQPIHLVVTGGTFLLIVSVLTALGIVLLIGVIGRRRFLSLRVRSLMMIGACLLVSGLATMRRGPLPAAIRLSWSLRWWRRCCWAARARRR
jgi:hypothetical protein